jgi:Bacterial tandem repeat domain 1
LGNWSNITQVEGWDAEQLEVFNINTNAAGRLFMQPHTCVWFNDFKGPFLFKELNGDFIFTTQVQVENRAGGWPPGTTFSLAGPMIRQPKTLTTGSDDWAPGQENYVFLSLGFGDPGVCGAPCAGLPPMHLETKATCSSHSDLQITPIGTQEITLRLAKIGNVIISLYQLPGGVFVVQERHRVANLCQNGVSDVMFGDGPLQVGLVAYTDWPAISGMSPVDHNNSVLHENPDLNARFEFARFNEVNIPPALAGLDFANPTQVSNAQLLSFLGFPSIPAACPPLPNPGGRYLSVWRAGAGAHSLRAGLNWTDFVEQWQAQSDAAHRLVDVDVYKNDGATLFNGVWEAGTDAHAFFRYNSFNSIIAKKKALALQGLQLIDIETDRVGNTQYYTGVWRAGTIPHRVYRFSKWGDLVNKWNSLNDEGYRLIDIEAYRAGASWRYLGIWQQGAGKYALYNYDNWESFFNRWQQLAEDGLRLIDIETYTQNGREHYLGVWRGGNDTYALFRDYSWEAFMGHYEAQNAAGLRLIDLERF